MDKDILWAWVIKNSVALLAWVALAVVFNKWWIALFSILFMSGYKQNISVIEYVINVENIVRMQIVIMKLLIKKKNLGGFMM